MIPFVILAIEDDEDRAFMTQVYQQYRRLIWSRIRKILKNECEPEDVFQDTLVKLVENVKKLRGMDTRSMVNYIITVAEHKSIDAIRRRNKTREDSINDEAWTGRYFLRSEEEVEELIFRRDSVGKLGSIWHLLDDRSRYLLDGKYFLDLTTREMGAVLNITHDSVRVELSRARKKARKLLEEQCKMTEL